MIKIISILLIMISVLVNKIPVYAGSWVALPNLPRIFRASISAKSLIDYAITIAGGLGILISLLLFALLIMIRKRLKLAKAELDNFNQLRQAFIDADETLTYLKDENLKYVFVNKAFEDFFQIRAEDVIGLDDYALKNDGFSKKRRETDLAVLKQKSSLSAKRNGKAECIR